MKFTKDNLVRLTAAVAKAITEREDEVFPYIGEGQYVLDQDGLYEVVKEALENA